MHNRFKLLVGLYGVAFHVLGVLYFAARGVPRGLVTAVLPPLLISAFLVYFFVVARYVLRRSGLKGLVLYDSAVGMLAECIVVASTVLLYSAGAATAVLRGGSAGQYFPALANALLVGLLGAFGSFMTEILVVGNAAGLIGWVVLQKLLPRLTRSA